LTSRKWNEPSAETRNSTVPALRYFASRAQPDGGLAHRVPGFRRDPDRGRLFDHLLVAALQAAFPLSQRDRVASVPQDLDLDCGAPARCISRR
jgi:hypothetical protein